MYSSEKNPGINWKDLIIKVIFFAIFILLLMWLFPKVPNMTAFYSNVFRENISYMQDAAKSYYTNERLPKNIGDKAEMTLQDMINKNLIIPFVDKDGNPCDTNESYVQVTKESEEEYSLKVNLVCDTESSYIIETLGCYDYCEGNKCETELKDENEEIAKQLQYEFRQAYTVNETSTKCDSSLYSTLINGMCYATTKAETSYETIDKLLETLKKDYNKEVSYDCSEIDTETICTTKYRTEYKTETFERIEYKTEQECTTKYEKESYACECTTKFVNGKYTTSCNTCYKTVPKKTCSNVSVPYTVTYTEKVPVQVPYQECNDYESTNSKICYKTETATEYYCPEQTVTQIGSGENLKCYGTDKIETANTCPNGYTYNSNLKLCLSNIFKKPVTNISQITKYKYKWSTSETLEGWERTGKTRSVAI